MTISYTHAAITTCKWVYVRDLVMFVEVKTSVRTLSCCVQNLSQTPILEAVLSEKTKNGLPVHLSSVRHRLTSDNNDDAASGSSDDDKAKLCLVTSPLVVKPCQATSMLVNILPFWPRIS